MRVSAENAAYIPTQPRLVAPQRMESVGRLTGGVAHEFNNKLQTILGSTELALMDVPEGGSVQRDLLQIRTAGRQAAAITQQLMAYARMQPSAPTTMNLPDAIAATLALVSPSVPAGIHVTTVLPRDTWPVLMDQGQFTDAITALLLNAADAIDAGARQAALYVDRMLVEIGDRVHIRTPVRSVRRESDGVALTVEGAGEQRYDQVIIATHSDQALSLLTDPSPGEQEILGAIRYQENDAVLHADASLLPRRKRAWAAWNYHLLPAQPDRAVVTYHMNRLQSLDAPHEFCVTLNYSARIHPDRILKRIRYHHPVYSPGAVAAHHLADRSQRVPVRLEIGRERRAAAAGPGYSRVVRRHHARGCACGHRQQTQCRRRGQGSAGRLHAVPLDRRRGRNHAAHAHRPALRHAARFRAGDDGGG